jgi:Fe-S-cluster containining protein
MSQETAPSAPWYADGLRFECTQCGDCCTGAPGYVWVNKQEIEALATRLGLTVLEFERQHVHKVGIRKTLDERAGGDCTLFDPVARRCTVYEDRPRQCRTWPFWDSNIRTPKAWQEAREACPGCGQGDLVPLEQVQAQAAVIRV